MIKLYSITVTDFRGNTFTREHFAYNTLQALRMCTMVYDFAKTVYVVTPCGIEWKIDMKDCHVDIYHTSTYFLKYLAYECM